MSITIETLLSCDGGVECPEPGIYCDGDTREQTAEQQRKTAKVYAGWVQRGSKDFCPSCAKRLGYIKEVPNVELSGPKAALSPEGPAQTQG